MINRAVILFVSTVLFVLSVLVLFVNARNGVTLSILFVLWAIYFVIIWGVQTLRKDKKEDEED